MDWTLEVVRVPVSDVDRAKDFYAEQLGFVVDFDTSDRPGPRFVQLTPPGSGCSIVIGGPADMEPGSLRGLQLVVPDITSARAELAERGVEVSDVQVFDTDGPRARREGDALDNVGFCHLADPDGNTWAIQQISSRAAFDVEVSQMLDASRDRVYAALTDPDLLAAWYGPEGFAVPRETVDLDVRVGGHQRFEMVSDADPALRIPLDARLTEVVEGRILMSTETWDGIPGVGSWTILRRIELHDEDGKTRLHLREGPHPEGHVELGRRAWQHMLATLAEVLRG